MLSDLELVSLSLPLASSFTLAGDIGRDMSVHGSDADRVGGRVEVVLGRADRESIAGFYAGSGAGLAFSPDSHTLAVPGKDSTVYLWDVGRRSLARRQLERPPRGWCRVENVAFSPDGRILASAGSTLHLWDTRTGRLIGPLLGPVAFGSQVAFSPDGRTLATVGYQGSVYLWDMRSFKPIRRLERGPHNYYGGGLASDLAFSPDGRTLATDGGGEEDWTVSFWDVPSGRPLGGLRANQRGSWSVAFSPDGHTLAAADGKDIQLWDLRDRQRLEPLPGGPLGTQRVVFSPDGRVIASVGFGWHVRLWDIRSHTQLGEPLRAEDIAFSPNGEIIAGSNNYGEAVQLWDARSRRKLGSPLRP